MSVMQAILLGIVQGITSALPVSSSGHLAVMGSWMGLNADMSLKFYAFLHLGTLIAVIVCFHRDIVRILKGMRDVLLTGIANLIITFSNLGKKKERRNYLSVAGSPTRKTALFILEILAASAVLALIFRPMAEAAAANLLVTAMGFLVTALLLFVSSYSVNKTRKLSSFRLKDALITGAFHGLSVLPGISRFGMVYTSGGILGMSGKMKVEIAYLLAVPTIIGGFLLEVFDSDVVSIRDIGLLPCFIGLAVAAVTGIVAISFLRKRLEKSDGRGLAVYCLVLGVLSIVSYI